MRRILSITLAAALMVVGFVGTEVSGAPVLADLHFTSGVDDLGNSTGDLVFYGLGGLQITFTDDDSGNASGVHITTTGSGNAKKNTSDPVMGALDTGTQFGAHTSGIVAMFNRGVESVSLFDTDNDQTVKALFAFDANGVVIGQTAFDAQKTFAIGTADTGGQLIHSVEFDTAAGTNGGANDGTFFTIDDFEVTGAIPEPASAALLLVPAAAVLGRRQSPQRLKRVNETLGL